MPHDVGSSMRVWAKRPYLPGGSRPHADNWSLHEREQYGPLSVVDMRDAFNTHPDGDRERHRAAEPMQSNSAL